MKILIIEDDVTSASMLEMMLSDDHEVIVSHTAEQAIESGVNFKPDLIISDWDLKEEMDGVAVCKKILDHHKAIVIFVSGSPLERLKELSLALAPLHILSKPIDLDVLTGLINTIRAPA